MHIFLYFGYININHLQHNNDNGNASLEMIKELKLEGAIVCQKISTAVQIASWRLNLYQYLIYDPPN